MDESSVGSDEALELRQLRQSIKRRLFRRADEPLRLGRFVLLERLGEGGMGVVFACYDPTLDRKVAIKVLRGQPGELGDRQRLRMLREAQALAKLSHPNVIAVFEVGELDGSVFIVMEFVRGTTLKAWLARPRRPVAEVLPVLIQAGRGLAAAHDAGLVHRDFKPENVMFGEDGSVRVLDFGLARSGSSSEDDLAATLPDLSPMSPASGRLTRTGVKAGTPGYMAPEQWAGSQPDTRSDQFSFCAVLHEALYGTRPHAGRTIAALSRPEEAPPAPRAPPRPDVPAWLHAAVLRGLSPAPDDRFASLAELLALLERDPEAERRRRRRWLAQIAAAIGATSALAAAVVYGSAALERHATERQAEARRTALRAESAELRARGETAAAARLLRTFVELPEHRGTAAIARVHLDWADDEPDHAAAVDAYASAYIAARTPADERAALVGLVRRLAARGSIDEASAALAVLERDAPAAAASPDLADIRLSAALHRRDLPAARAALAAGGVPDRWGHVLEDLSRVTLLPRRHFGAPAGEWIGLRAGDLDGDGDPEVVAVDRERGDAAVVLRGDPVFSPLGAPPLGAGLIAVAPVPFAVGREPLVLGSRRVDPGCELRLQRLDGSSDDLPRWIDSEYFVATATDLDGDGRTELYVGTGAYERRLWRLERADDGTWSRRPAHPPTDASRSDFNDLVAGDLDGDGRPELVAAVGPWNAYDLRVLRAGARGELELVARKAFGNIRSLALLRAQGETMIAFVKNDEYPTEGRFPPDQPLGAPAGLYLAGLRGGAIEVLAFLPDRGEGRPPLALERLFAGDLDGDASDELVAVGAGKSLVLLRWRPGEPLRPLVVPSLEPVLVLDVDGDARAEVVAVPADDPQHALLLGAGEATLTPADRPVVAPRPVPTDLADPLLAAAWSRGEQLVAIGLLDRPADELAALARLSGRAATDMLIRSGELYAHLGDDARAAEQFLAAAERPARAAEALAGAAASRRRLGEFAAAAALTRARLMLPELPSGAQEQARRELAALEAATAARPELALDFTRPLDPRWRIHDPLAVQRDPGRRDLSVWSSLSGVAAELPLVWDSGPAALEVELEVDRLEWGVELAVGVIGPAADRTWIGARVGAFGAYQRRELGLSVFDDRGQIPRVVAVSERTRVRARVAVFPGLDTTITEVEVEGRPTRREVRPAGSSVTPDAGPVRLQIDAVVQEPDLVGHAWITAIRLVGFRLAPAPEASGAEPAALLADYELVSALDALADRDEPHARLWRAEILARLGRIDAASDELRALVPAGGEPLPLALHHRLRRGDDALALAAHAALGPRYVDVVGGRLLLIGQEPRTTDLVEALAGRLDRSGEPADDPAGRARQADALLLRGRALAHVGRFEDATAAYAAALALLDDPARPVPDDRHRRAVLLHARIDLAARTGDSGAARRWIGAALALSGAPELELERFQADPALADLFRPDDWAALARTP